VFSDELERIRIRSADCGAGRRPEHEHAAVVWDRPGLPVLRRIHDGPGPLYRTDWQDYVITQADGREISPITGQDASLSDSQPTHQVRVGGEYLFIRKNSVIPVRAGLFYDPEPTANSPDDFYGISIGSGIAKGRIVFDAAYQYRWGNNVRMVRLGTEEVEQDVQQHTIYMSVIYHF
jgi:hypothetical protein